MGLAQHQLQRRQTTETIAQHCTNGPDDNLPCGYHFDACEKQRQLETHKHEALGCVRYIASLSRVDGFVLLDRSLTVHGFGVESRSAVELTDIHISGDTSATTRLLRPALLSQFGTRHRAMMRYCYEHAGALGFVISQDGDNGQLLGPTPEIFAEKDVDKVGTVCGTANDCFNLGGNCGCLRDLPRVVTSGLTSRTSTDSTCVN